MPRRALVPAVDQPVRVDVPQGGGERGGERAYAVGAERPVLAHGVVEGGPGREPGGDPGPAVVAVDLRVQDAGDAAAGDRLGGVRLAQEALDEVRVVRELAQQHHDGRGAAASSRPKYPLPVPPSPRTPSTRYGPSRIGSPAPRGFMWCCFLSFTGVSGSRREGRSVP
ncbi:MULTISPECIES: hypothetical protein [unclassified Streptomyces]|uniref:hypothetical protein n=1 Tax=unclassified Streptomyces TaxID=2593676 RepID=UPI003873410B